MIKLPIPSLEGHKTERLEFRRPVMEDRTWWMGYLNDPEAIRFMPFAVGSEDDCALFIQRSLDRMAKDGSGLHAVIERETGKPVGMIGLLTQEVDGRPELEVGYHLLPRHGAGVSPRRRRWPAVNSPAPMTSHHR